MRVLLAGASGAIGRYLLPRLLNAGHEVIGVTRVRGALSSTGATELVADVVDRAAFLGAVADLRVDAVVHQLTALRKPPLSRRDMAATNRLRSEGTSTLLAAARLMGASKFVAGSVFYGYGFADHGGRLLTESDPFGEPDGRNDAVLRALSSLEQQVRAFGGVSLRYGLFYDPSVHRVSPVARSWNGRIPLLHIEDAASAAVAALERGAAGEVYNVADDQPASYRDLQKALATASSRRAPFELPDGLLRLAAPFAGELATRTRIRMSTEKSQRDLAWSPAFPTLAAGIAAASPVPPIAAAVSRSVRSPRLDAWYSRH